MTVRLLGVYNDQPWGSSPIFLRENATLLRTRSGILRFCFVFLNDFFSIELDHSFVHLAIACLLACFLVETLTTDKFAGKLYALDGSVHCEGLQTEGFSDDICHRFKHGFPFHWKSYLAKVWNEQQAKLRAEFFQKQSPNAPLTFEEYQIDESRMF